MVLAHSLESSLARQKGPRCMSGAYYNEFDPFAAAWLRELIKTGQIADGEVDERSITDVRPDDLRGFTQCHFFAGIGGWSLALRLAGWSDDKHVWTGSCPCQPWSVAGKSQGADDPRDLWPSWRGLIGELCPSTVFGEQVPSQDALLWLDRTAEDLESSRYAFGALVLPAVGVGAPHRRDRIYFVAHSTRAVAAGRHPHVWRLAGAQSLARPWAFADWQGGRDGYRVLDDGLSTELAKRVAGGYGNAIVPQVAAVFIESYLECLAEAA